VNRLERYVRWLGRDDPLVKELLERVELRPDMARSVEARLLQLVEQKGGNIIDLPPFTLAPPSRNYINPFCIGRAVQGTKLGYDYLVDTDSLMQSGTMVGVPGSGKSTLADIMAIGVVQSGGRAIIFDSMHEHHQLIRAFPGECYVFELGRTEKENPLQPPGNLCAKDWIGVQKDILREQFLRDGGTNLHEDVMNRTYTSYGVFDGGKNYPTLKRILLGSLEKTDFKLGTRYYGFKESLTDRLRTLASVPSFDVVEGYDLAEILKSAKIVIFRLGTFSSDVKMFYVNVKLEKIRRCLSEHLGEFGRVLIVVEEAYELASPQLRKRTEITEPLIYRFIRQARRYNASFLLIDQFAAGIPRPIWACFNNIFVLRQSEMSSISMISDARNLDEEQTQFLSIMPLRHVVHAPSDDQPRLIKVADLNLPHVSETELDSYMKPILHRLRYVQADGSSVTPVEISNQDDAKGIKIRKIDRQILEKVFECPFRNTEKISEFMGNLNLAVAKRSLKKLETQGYVKSFNANLGFGRPKKLYIGTEKGATLLGEDYKKVKPKGKGSLLHQAAQHLLSGALGDSGQEGFGGA
jgi:hypothetical protein